MKGNSRKTQVAVRSCVGQEGACLGRVAQGHISYVPSLLCTIWQRQCWSLRDKFGNFFTVKKSRHITTSFFSFFNLFFFSSSISSMMAWKKHPTFTSDAAAAGVDLGGGATGALALNWNLLSLLKCSCPITHLFLTMMDAVPSRENNPPNFVLKI